MTLCDHSVMMHVRAWACRYRCAVHICGRMLISDVVSLFRSLAVLFFLCLYFWDPLQNAKFGELSLWLSVVLLHGCTAMQFFPQRRVVADSPTTRTRHSGHYVLRGLFDLSFVDADTVSYSTVALGWLCYDRGRWPDLHMESVNVAFNTRFQGYA